MPVAEATFQHQEIVQQDYGKPNHRRISYGPNGVSLVDALRGVPYGDSDRIAFEGVEMSQKMSVRYQVRLRSLTGFTCAMD